MRVWKKKKINLTTSKKKYFLWVYAWLISVLNSVMPRRLAASIRITGSRVLPQPMASLPMSGRSLPSMALIENCSSSLGVLYLLKPISPGNLLALIDLSSVNFPAMVYSFVVAREYTRTIRACA